MKYELGSLTWVSVLLLIVIISERCLAIHEYHNNAYEVSAIDRRITIPRPDGPPSHTSLKRHQITLFEDDAQSQQYPAFKRHRIIHKKFTPVVLKQKHGTTAFIGRRKQPNFLPLVTKKLSAFTSLLGRPEQESAPLVESKVKKGYNSLLGRGPAEKPVARFVSQEDAYGPVLGRTDKASLLNTETQRVFSSLLGTVEENVHPPRGYAVLLGRGANIVSPFVRSNKQQNLRRGRVNQRQYSPLTRRSNKKPALHHHRDHMGSRRQEIIHALNDDNGKTAIDSEDDIESLGRRIDESGNEIKDTTSKKDDTATLPTMTDKHTAAATKYIISKIKEIQEKLFKRTGSKALEEKLNEMDPTGLFLNKKNTTATTKNESNADSKTEEKVKKNATASSETKSETKSETTAAEKKEVNNKTEDSTKLTDGSKVPDRRKIIPEEVVDKILEKFQQLKSEAKHIVTSKSRHSVEHADNEEGKELKTTEDFFNPYASIGKPRPNKTSEKSDSMSNLLSQKDENVGSIQIPLDSVEKKVGKGKKKGPVPIMFIKNGDRLVPVFGSTDNLPIQSPSPEMTTDGDARARLDGNSGVAEQRLPFYVTQMKGPDGDRRGAVTSVTDHILDRLNINSGVANPDQVPMPVSTISNIKVPYRGGSGFNRMSQDHDADFEHFKEENDMQIKYSSEDEPPSSRCAIPGYNCNDPMSQGTPQRKDTRYQNPHIPTTEDIIESVLHSPEFPMVAAHILHKSMSSHGSRYGHQDSDFESSYRPNDDGIYRSDSNYPDDRGSSTRYFRGNPDEPDPSTADLTRFASVDGDDRGSSHSRHQIDLSGPLRDSLKDVHMLSTQDLNEPSSSVQGMNPGTIQFNMQQNLAHQMPGEFGMFDQKRLMNEAQSSDLAPEPPSYDPRNSQVISDDLQKQMGLSQQLSNYMNPDSPEVISRVGSSRHVISGQKSNDLFQNPDPSFITKVPASSRSMSRSSGLDFNDISDPPQKLDSTQQEFVGQTPDQLLEYAKRKTFQQQFQSTTMDRMNHERIDSDQNLPNIDPGSNMPMMIPKSQMSPDRDSQQPAEDPAQLLDTVHGNQFDMYSNGERPAERPGTRHSIISSRTRSDAIGGSNIESALNSPTMQNNGMVSKDIENSFDGDRSPDMLLEMLRRQKDRTMGFAGGMDPETLNKYKKARFTEESARQRGEIPLSDDPSLADDINGGGGEMQQMEIQSKELASDNHKDSRFLRDHRLGNLHHNQISVVPGNLIQYNHGKMSMDSADVVNSFFKDKSFYYRNKIPRPINGSQPMVRASIYHNLQSDKIELRVNGKKLSSNQKARRSRLGNKKSKNPYGETIFSKGPIKVELSHGLDKRKIVNIITQSQFNVTDDRKRTHIPKVIQNVHD